MMATLRAGKPDAAERARALILYVSVVLLATLIGGHLLGLWSAGLDTPNAYSSDTLLTSTVWKGIIDEGQPYTNPSLGAPGEGQMYDFPGADGLLNLEVWLLALFTSDYAVLLNLFALLTFPLIALTAAWALRKLGMSRMAAFVFSILFACLPFHQTRIDGHQYLSAYFVVPLAVALIATVVLDLDRRRDMAPTRPAWRLPLWAWLAAIALGSCGVYYAYFGIVLAILAGIIAAYSSRDLRRLVPAAVVVGVVVLTLALQYAPSYLFWQREGANSTADARQPFESDLYALRMTELVFPATGHRIKRFADAKQFLKESLYAVSPNNVGIADDSSLGIIGVIGFFTLLFWLATAAFRAPPEGSTGTPAKLSLLGVAAFLLATVGGVGGLIAFAGFPQIRAYERITPYIGFVSLAASAWLADRIAQSIRRDTAAAGGILRLAGVAVCFAGLLAFGVLDQTSHYRTPNYEAIAEEFDSDGEFARQIEATLPDDAMVFQLPYVSFPESPPVVGTAAYDPLRMYLHSESIHWSAGAFRGRDAAIWQQSVAESKPGTMLDRLREAGFAGLVIDRAGYEDGGAELEQEIRRMLDDAEYFASPNGRFVFYPVAP